MTGYKKTGRPFREQMDEEASARRHSGGSASGIRDEEEEEEEDEEEEETQTRISSLAASSMTSSRSSTSVDDILALVKSNPDLLKTIIANNQEESSDMLVLTRKEADANRMMDFDADEFKKEYSREFYADFHDYIGRNLEKALRADRKRSKFFRDKMTHDVAVNKFIELNEFSEKFEDTFRDAFEDALSEYREDFKHAFVGQFLREGEEEEQDADGSSDYDDAASSSSSKKRRKSAGTSPAKKGRSGNFVTAASPSKVQMDYGDEVEVYEQACDEWQTRVIGQKNTGGYVSMVRAKTLFRSGHLRVPE
jgi:hypothetical protein